MNQKTITLTLPDGNKKEVQSGTTYLEFIKNQMPFLLKKALAVKIDQSKILDLSAKIEYNCSIQILTFGEEDGWDVFQHSSAHLLGMAVQKVWKNAKLTVGPVVKSGPGFFYYDIFSEEEISINDFPKIEEEMKNIVQSNLEVYHKVLTKDEAIQTFQNLNETFKVELINSFPLSEEIKVYGQGDWFDLCRGPHVPNTGLLKAFKLTSLSGAYWKGNKENQMLTRIYGVAFPSKTELDDYLYKLEEAKKRDHRKLGKELDLFSFQKESPGMPFWHPKGTVIWNQLVNYIREECDNRGYQEIRTPYILNSELWKKSGHWDNFKENMYFTKIDEEDFAVKPMNCPGCSLVYNANLHSYKELPLRFTEFGTVHRHELHGVLHGLFRVRAFTQDDAHIYASLAQLGTEIENIIDFTFEVYRKFGFKEFKTFIATRPEKSLGNDADWESATNILKESLKKKGIPFGIKEGEGAFYGPKIEFNIEDSLSRNWQCGTVQVDFSMPGRFDLNYTDQDGLKHNPIMIHRAIFGSLERFIGILIEHFEGKFPFWLSPNQISILTITDSANSYAKELEQALKNQKYRVEIDMRNEKIGYKIREAILKKVNYILVVGEKEAQNKTVNVRKRGEETGVSYSIDDFILMLKNKSD